MKDFKMKVTAKGQEPFKLEQTDLIQNCWQYIADLEHLNPMTVEEFGYYDFIDQLLNNFFTLKMVFNEYGQEPTPEMVRIEEFITKYLKRFFNAINEQELYQHPPAFSETLQDNFKD